MPAMIHAIRPYCKLNLAANWCGSKYFWLASDH
jgi:hypothetical protein